MTLREWLRLRIQRYDDKINENAKDGLYFSALKWEIRSEELRNIYGDFSRKKIMDEEV